MEHFLVVVKNKLINKYVFFTYIIINYNIIYKKVFCFTFYAVKTAFQIFKGFLKGVK